MSFVYNATDNTGQNPNSNQISPHDPAKPNFGTLPNAAQVVFTFYNPWSFPILVRLEARPATDFNDPAAPRGDTGLYLHDPTGLDVTDEFTITAVGPTVVEVPPRANTVDDFGEPAGPTGPTVIFNLVLKDQPQKAMSILLVDAEAVGTVMQDSDQSEKDTWGEKPNGLAWARGDTIPADPGPFGGTVLDPAELQVVYKAPGYEGPGRSD